MSSPRFTIDCPELDREIPDDGTMHSAWMRWRQARLREMLPVHVAIVQSAIDGYEYLKRIEHEQHEALELRITRLLFVTLPYPEQCWENEGGAVR